MIYLKGVIHLDNTFYGALSAMNAGKSPMQDNGREVVAMAYVPVQKLETVYETDQAYDRGTLFPQLDKPWLGGLFGE